MILDLEREHLWQSFFGYGVHGDFFIAPLIWGSALVAWIFFLDYLCPGFNKLDKKV